MWVGYVLVWVLAGALTGAIAAAVSPPLRLPAKVLVVVLGMAGGVGGGLLAELMGRRTVPGSFTAGLVGCLMGAMVLLIAVTLVHPLPVHRAA